MRILLHACCADCALKFIESTKKEDGEITIYYYNPNIHPRAEYSARLAAMQKVAKEKGVEIIVPDWRPVEYFEKIKSKKIGERCIDCWKLRLEATAKYGKEKGFDCFSSTLISSEYQDQEKIAEIAMAVEKKYGIKFFKINNINKELKTSGFYKQFFCGCGYSLLERYEEKYMVK